MVMVKSRKLRQRKEFILVEGKRLIKDALEAGCSIQHLMFSRKSDLEYIRHLLPHKDIHLYKMAYRDIQMWSDLTTSPGIMGKYDIKLLNLFYLFIFFHFINNIQIFNSTIITGK